MSILSFAVGVSNATSNGVQLPISSGAGALSQAMGFGADNAIAKLVSASINASSATLDSQPVNTSLALGAWTNTGNKSINVQITYPI
jgi:hypothetical protein